MRHKDIFMRLNWQGQWEAAHDGEVEGPPKQPQRLLAAAPRACEFAPVSEIDQGAYGLREGEVAVELPERFDASLYYIGRIRTPWKRREDCPKNPRESDAECTIALDSRWTAGLSGLETVSHVVVLYCRRRIITSSVAAPSRCARRCGLIQLPSRWRGSSASTATTYRSSASIAWTTRRCSISSPISPRPIRYPTRRWAGTPGATADSLVRASGGPEHRRARGRGIRSLEVKSIARIG
jgi:hypothetical protein